MQRRFRTEVHFGDGRVSIASDMKDAQRLVKSRPEAAEVWLVWPNDLGVGTRIDRAKQARHPTR